MYLPTLVANQQRIRKAGSSDPLIAAHTPVNVGCPDRGGNGSDGDEEMYSEDEIIGGDCLDVPETATTRITEQGVLFKMSVKTTRCTC